MTTDSEPKLQEPLHLPTLLHVLRNPYGYSETQLRLVRLRAADELERAAGYSAGAAEVREALRELVACKDLKERIATYNPTFLWSIEQRQEYADMRNDYDERKPKAWAAARAALSKAGDRT